VWSLLHLVSCRVWPLVVAPLFYFNLVSTSLPVKMDLLTGDEVWICLVARSRGVEGKSKAPQVLSGLDNG
jgi:hypothetical protein